MKVIIVLACICAMAASVPVITKVRPVHPEFPALIRVEASNPVEAVRKARQLFDIDINFNDNYGPAYFDNGDEYYNNGYGGYGGYNGGFGSGFGYPGYGYGGFF